MSEIVDDLLPCPFCGQSASVVQVGDEFSISCRGIKCFGPVAMNYSSIEDVTFAWNQRDRRATGGEGVGVTDEMVERGHRAQMSELFLRCQPDRGDVFAFMDDRKDVMRIALMAAFYTSPKATKNEGE